MSKCMLPAMGSIVSLFVLVLLASNFSSLFGQNPNQMGNPVDQASQSYAELKKVPQGARTRHNPFEGDSTAVAAGRKLFGHHCAECHGNRAQGGRKGPNLRVSEVQTATPGMLFWILSNGVVRRGMPVWSKLPEPQRWQIVSYLKNLD